MAFSVVIPSKNAANLLACVRAIREAGETCRIIVVDDGLPGSPDFVNGDALGLDAELDKLVTGDKPFIFARNVNIGIRAAGEDDVIVLNDDALPKTPMGFTKLAKLAAHGTLGMIAAACNTVGNPNQFQRLEYADVGLCRAEHRMVCFVCVYIPRKTIDTVGLLDERFVGYGMDDDDYSLRVRNAGLKLGIFDGCYVDHGSLTSSYRGGPVNGGDFRPNMRLFIEKWGVDNRGKNREQSEWAHLWPEVKA